MQVSQITGRRLARIYHNHTHFRPRLLGPGDSSIEHRMAPGDIRTGQYDQIGLLKIFITTGYGIRAESPFMACH